MRMRMGVGGHAGRVGGGRFALCGRVESLIRKLEGGTRGERRKGKIEKGK